jgi:hypothetical protein
VTQRAQRDAGSSLITGSLASLLESLRTDDVLIDLEDSLERVSDTITVIGGSLRTVMLHWDELAEADRTDLIARAQRRADEIIPALAGDGRARPAALGSSDGIERGPAAPYSLPDGGALPH